MTNIIKQNYSENFSNNEGKSNSKGMVAPPVPPKSHQTKFAGIKAIFEQNASHSQANDSNKTVSSNLGRTFGPTMRKLMEDGDVNIHGSVNTPNKQRRNSGDSGISSYSSASSRTSDDKGRVIEEKVMENVNAFEQDNHQKSSDSHQAQATVDDMLCEGINDSTPCLIPQKSEVLTAAKNELETIKFLKTLSKKERENLGFSPKQQDNHKVETSRKTYNPLDWNPIYQGKKHFSLDNMSSNSSSCSEKSNISDISDKSNDSNIVRCNITRSNSRKDFRKPDAKHNDKPTDKKLSDVKVSELVRKFEQNNEIIKGR